MAQSKDNFMTHGLSGTIGRLITFTLRGGKTIVGKLRRKTTREPSVEQLEIRNTFGQAVIYAKAAIKDADTKAAYATRADENLSAYNVALADACIPPKVVSINKDNYHGQSDDTVLIEATDDFKVAQVKVAIHTAGGEFLEEGNAVAQIDGLHWVFTPSMENEEAVGSTIKVTAYDLAGNEGFLEVTV